MPFQYTFRGSDISSWESAARDLVENRDRELELYSTTIDTSFLNLNASNLTSGTVPSARMTGAYTGITGLGTLTGLNVLATTGTAVRITNTGTGNSFLVEDSASTDATPFVIDAAGNVGIGTASPGARFDVQESGSTVAMRITNAGSQNSFVVEDSASTDSTPFVISATGNVGIGVTTPSAKLDIIGAQIIRAGSTQDGIGLQGRPGGTSSWSVLLYPATLTGPRTLTLPDVNGTAITTGNLSDITSVGTLGTLNVSALNSSGTMTASGRIWAQTDLRVGNSTSTVLSSTLYNLVVTPQAYTGLQVLLGEHYGLTGVGTTNNDFTVFANATVRIKYVNNTIATFNSAGMTLNGDASLSGQSLAVTNLAAGRGMCIRADPTDAYSILQFTNNAVSAQWSSIVATNNLLNVTSPLSVTGDVTTSGSLKLSASTNAYVSYANTPDTALPWMQGPTFQGQTGWAFYQQVTASYRMGFRSGSSGATRYMWSADPVLIGLQPNDASITRTLNVIGTGRFTEILNPNGGISGTVNYGSYGSFSVYSETNGWYGIAFPDSQSAWMSANNGQYFGVYRNNATWNFYVVNGTFTPSDERYKRDIEPLQHGMNLIRGIVPITFDPLTEDPADDPEQTVGRTHYGFTTQNILQALANVGETRDVAIVDIGGPANESNESDRQYLNHSALIAPMIKAIQELDQRLQQLETV